MHCQGLSGFLGYETFSIKTWRILGKPGPAGHPNTLPWVMGESKPIWRWKDNWQATPTDEYKWEQRNIGVEACAM